MRIKTITCHNVYNFGASLQAYALMKYLQIQGNDVEIIDYMPTYFKFNLWAIGPRWNRNIVLKLLFFLYIVPQRLLQYKMRKKFDAFTKDYLILTPKTYSNNDELKKEPPIADIYIAGSDQIWNTESPNGKDPAFFLNFAPNSTVKASYAASFSIKYILEDYIPIIKKELQQFKCISVRERSGLDILQSIGISGELVLDPVFLLDKSIWESLALMDKTNEKYILIYDQENNPKIKNVAKRIAKNKGLKIFAIRNFYPMSYANKRIEDIGPREFLGLIKNSEIVLTNSFHATAFSIIFQKDFYVFNRTHQKVNSRMQDLIDILKINDRLIDNKLDFAIKSIDYENVKIRLLKYRNLSIDYLNRVCSNKQ